MRRFGDYEILGEIARGGMGVVYRARQVSLNRMVALKMVRDAHLASPQAVRRFRVEAETVARLEHPNIVPIYEFGEVEGHWFISMKLVQGNNLAEELHGVPMEAEQAATMMQAVARAVHYAHQHGVLHRDLKPANVLVEGHSHPYVTDFGVAKIDDRAAALTLTSDVLGSPNYMAPEQAAGKHDAVTTESDVYSLGAMLYQLLTGRAPFRAETPLETMRKVLEEEPIPPRAVYKFASRDLEIICLKCLEKEPARRYASAEALAEDLERSLRQEPILAKPTSVLERARKWVRRNPALATLTGLLAVVLTLGLAGVLVLSARLAVEAKENHDRLVRMNIAAGDHLVQEGDYFGGLLWFAETLRLDQGSPREENHRHRIASTLLNSPRLAQEFQITGTVDNLVFSPDGRRVAAGCSDHAARVWVVDSGELAFPPLRSMASLGSVQFSRDGNRLLTMAGDGAARVWDAHTGQAVTPELRAEDFDANSIEASAHRLYPSASFSPEGDRVLTAWGSASARVWDARTGVCVLHLPHQGIVNHAAYSRDGRWIVTSSSDGTAQVWDAVNGRHAAAPLRHDHFVAWSEFSPDGRHLMTVSDRRTVKVWDWLTGQRVGQPISHNRVLFHASFSPDGTKVLTASWDMTARLWDATTGQALGKFEHNGGLYAAVFSPSGEWFATACHDGTARVWDVAQSSRATAALPQGSAVRAVAFSPDGQWLAAGSTSGQVRVWDLAIAGPAIKDFPGEQTIWASFAPDGRRVVTAGAWGAKEAQVWDARAGSRIGLPMPHASAVRRAEFSPDGNRILTTSDDRAVRVWDARDGRPITGRLAHPSRVGWAVFSPDGRSIVTACDDGAARIWDAASGKAGPVLRHDKAVTYVVCSPDGKLVATASRDGTARLWSLDSGMPQSLPLAHATGLNCVAFSPDGRELATACESRQGDRGSIHIWEVRTGRELVKPMLQDGAVLRVEFSRDGRRLAAASADRMARIWDPRTGQPVTPILAHDDSVLEARFSPDGKRVATLTSSGSLRLWDATTGDSITQPLQKPRQFDLGHLCFSPDGTSLIVATGGDAAWILAFPRTTRPVGELLFRAELLSGRHIDTTGAMATLDAATLMAMWAKDHHVLRSSALDK